MPPRLVSNERFTWEYQLGNYIKKLFVKSSFAMADYEVVDQKKYLEDTCKPKCAKPLHAYQACAKRIKCDETGHKHCTGQYFDYWSCVDNCVAPKLFNKLK
ncbi:hypothetical protein Nepgr_026965 [Nepenthes gracilis]|uniref:Complex III subunit VI n=1 Tax=Nepenthes gracilis TaxID=150966 RepID=A0AAD3Y0V6_NEPGR|nr:hypothetical protein Nepgr_026965 [Nepenthes gracilis]